MTTKKNKTILFVVLFVLNLCLTQVFKIKITPHQVLTINVFLFCLSILTDRSKQRLSLKKRVSPTYLFIINASRILLCVVFLFPAILKHNNSHNGYIYNFFIVYFVYLFHDVISNKKRQVK